MDRLRGRVAVVTGACSGIGLGTVELFVAEGALVVVSEARVERARIAEARRAAWEATLADNG